MAGVLEHLLAERTAIAYRLSTVRNADRICVIDGGRIVDRRSDQKLLAQSGLYRDPHKRQSSAWEENASAGQR